MQTFLPFKSYTKSAAVLDNRRLGKQRVEVLQILNALRQPNYGWKNHPAVKMWAGYEYSLCQYGISICAAWVERGFKDTCYDKIYAKMEEIIYDGGTSKLDLYPAWLVDVPTLDRVTRSHRSNLLRKNPEHYRQFWPDLPDDIPYWWPTQQPASHAASQGEEKAA